MASPRSNRQLEIRLHRAVREFPRYNQFLVKVAGSELALAEAHLLVEVDTYGQATHSDLVQLIGINKVVLSKMVKGLLERKIVRVLRAAHDQRLKQLSLTDKGTRLLSVFDRHADLRLDSFVREASYTSLEVQSLARFLDRLATALDAPPSKGRENEHPLRAPIRRLTRAFKLLGDTSLDTNLTALEWQALLTIAEFNGRLSPSDLAELFHVGRVTIAIGLRTLQRFKFIQKVRNLADGRSDLLCCTDRGRALIKRVEDDSARAFSALAKLSEPEVLLVERFIRGAAVDFYINQQSLEVRLLTSESELRVARRALFEQLRNDPEAALPEYLFCRRNLCAGLYRGNTLLAAIELEGREPLALGAVVPVNLVAPRQLHPDSLRALMLKALKSDLITPLATVNSSRIAPLLPHPSLCSSLGKLLVSRSLTSSWS